MAGKGQNGVAEDRGFAELRDLLLGPERAQLDEIEEHIRNRARRAGDVSEVLPDAIVLRAGQDGSLRKALQPTLVEAIRASVRKDPSILAEALFPMIGSAVRRAVSEALADLTDSLNQMVETSLTLRSLQWRWEAMRTGKSYGEIALVRSLLYRVEQVFLIHSASGLMLQHAMSRFAAVKDPDMVSGMLTAIQDFVHDSFGAAENTLEMLRVGEYSIWVQHGPRAILAGVVSGTPPPGLRTVFATALETIQRDFAAQLTAFDGDAAPFTGTRDILEKCLLGQAPPARGRSYAWLYILGAALLLLIGAWTVRTVRERQRWNSYVSAVSREPGIVVVNKETRLGGKHAISGLRDPLARDPAVWLPDYHIPPDQVTFQWESYTSLAPSLASRREFEQLRDSLMRQRVLFAEGRSEMDEGKVQSLAPVAEQIRSLLAVAGTLGRQVFVELAGHTDVLGSEETNQRLAPERANQVKRVLIEYGIDPSLVGALGAGTEPGTSVLNRAVTFRVLSRKP
jgi:outer membrane protein OmpA-like peptidoglycan-associated protein